MVRLIHHRGCYCLSRGAELLDVCCLNLDRDVHPGIEAVWQAFSYSATEKRGPALQMKTGENT
jgi:hypothetical protein